MVVITRLIFSLIIGKFCWGLTCPSFSFQTNGLHHWSHWVCGVAELCLHGSDDLSSFTYWSVFLCRCIQSQQYPSVHFPSILCLPVDSCVRSTLLEESTCKYTQTCAVHLDFGWNFGLEWESELTLGLNDSHSLTYSIAAYFSVPTLIFESDIWFHSWFDNHDVQMATATLNQVHLVQPLLPIIFDTLTLIQNFLNTSADCALEIMVHSTFQYIPRHWLTWFRAQSLDYSCRASGWTAGVFLCRSLVVWEETRFNGHP
jgi:hypothetical protein